MKHPFSESIEVPSDIQLSIEGNTISFKKGAQLTDLVVRAPTITLKKEANQLVFEAKKANKNELKVIKANIAHVKNILKGFTEEFAYTLQACNVHFPMTLKVEGTDLVITNFLGEKKQRRAHVVPGVKVDIKGQMITLTSHDKEKAGQTAANIEKATKVKNRDRRIFQDGIYIIEKPGRMA